MPRSLDSGHVDLNQVFLHMQSRMLSHLEVGSALEHASTCGAASEAHWINLLNSHLPERYRASSVFVVDSDGNRSRQIDIAIYDRFYSPLIFPYESGYLVPAESVYAVVEVKQVLTRQYVRDAGLKIGSVRRLRRTSVPVPFAGGRYPPKRPHPILGVVAATRSVWVKDFRENLGSALAQQGRLGREQQRDCSGGSRPVQAGKSGSRAHRHTQAGPRSDPHPGRRHGPVHRFQRQRVAG